MMDRPTFGDATQRGNMVLTSHGDHEGGRIGLFQVRLKQTYQMRWWIGRRGQDRHSGVDNNGLGTDPHVGSLNVEFSHTSADWQSSGAVS